MTASNAQILALAQQGLSAVEIAESLGYQTQVVELVLTGDSEVKRELEKSQARVEANTISDGLKRLETLSLKTAEEIIKYSDNDSVRAQMVRYVFDAALGLKKAPEIKNTINITELNIRLEKMRDRLQKINEIVPIEAEVVGGASG